MYAYYGYAVSSTSFGVATNDLLFGQTTGRIGGADWRSYVQMDPTKFSNRKVRGARLNLKVNSCSSVSGIAPYGARSITVFKLIQPYYYGNVSTTTWPGPNFDFPRPFSGLVTGPNTTITFDITPIVQEWSANPASNYGLIIKTDRAIYCRAAFAESRFEVDYADPTILDANTELLPNEYLQSSSGRFQLWMQGDGNVVLYDTSTTPSGVVYQTFTNRTQSGIGDNAGARLAIQGTGNLVVYSVAGAALWFTRLPNDQGDARYMKVTDEGRIAIFSRSGGLLWYSPLPNDPNPFPTGGPIVPAGQRFRDGFLTPIEVPRENKCLAPLVLGSLITIPKSANDCQNVIPTASGGGYLLKTDRDGNCLGRSGTTLAVVSCAGAPTWRDGDPQAGRNAYPTTDNIFPVYFDDPAGPQCLTRSATAVVVVGCPSVDTNTQVWTDGYATAVSATEYDITMRQEVTPYVFRGPVYDYSPSVAGDRIFWCAGLGTDTLVSAKLGYPVPRVLAGWVS